MEGRGGGGGGVHSRNFYIGIPGDLKRQKMGDGVGVGGGGSRGVGK